MFDSIYIIFVALFIKHWYIDFINQSMEEVVGKGIYGNAYGVMHSLKHGVATFLIFWFFLGNWPLAIILGFIDFVLHYHIDYFKQKLNKGLTTADRMFWVWLGADQALHYLTYVGIISYVTLS